MSSTTELASGSLSPRTTTSPSPKNRNAVAQNDWKGTRNIGFFDYIDCIKQWAQKVLPAQFYESEQHVLEALETLFEKQGTNVLNIEAFSEVTNEDFAPQLSSVHRNIAKSFQEAELIKCVVRLVWLELINDDSPETSYPDTLQLSSEEVLERKKRATIETQTINLEGFSSHFTSLSHSARRVTRATDKPKVSVKLTVKKHPETDIEWTSYSKGVWCQPAREVCSKLQAIPGIELSTPPLTYRLNGQEVHVYNIAASSADHGGNFDGLSSLWMDLNLVVQEGDSCSIRGKKRRGYFVSVRCSRSGCHW